VTATVTTLATKLTTNVDRDAFPYKMKDLSEKTGLPRQVIHFYIKEGLVPEGRKTGRNMAYYGDAHLDRIRLVRKLQHERFLPLKAIRALLESQESAFSAAQRRLLGEVQQRLAYSPWLAARGGSLPTLAAPILERNGLDRADLEELAEAGILGVSTDEAGRAIVAGEDAWILDLWGELRAAGFTREVGFRAADFAIYEEAMTALLDKEAEMLTTRLGHLPPDRVAEMVERGVPLVNTFLARYHTAKVRDFFTALAGG
jgi:DNA-binding transcriptional MerR regulator